MKREKIVSVALTNDEHRELMTFIAKSLIDDDNIIRKSDVIREALFKYIRNGNSSPSEQLSQDTSIDSAQDNEQDTEQTPANKPAAFNFDDLSLD